MYVQDENKPKNCRYCNAHTEDTYHIHFDCPAFEAIRNLIADFENPNMTAQNVCEMASWSMKYRRMITNDENWDMDGLTLEELEELEPSQ